METLTLAPGLALCFREPCNPHFARSRARSPSSAMSPDSGETSSTSSPRSPKTGVQDCENRWRKAEQQRDEQCKVSMLTTPARLDFDDVQPPQLPPVSEVSISCFHDYPSQQVACSCCQNLSPSILCGILGSWCIRRAASPRVPDCGASLLDNSANAFIAVEQSPGLTATSASRRGGALNDCHSCTTQQVPYMPKPDVCSPISACLASLGV
jgi:hypothetical protein